MMKLQGAKCPISLLDALGFSYGRGNSPPREVIRLSKRLRKNLRCWPEGRNYVAERLEWSKGDILTWRYKNVIVYILVTDKPLEIRRQRTTPTY